MADAKLSLKCTNCEGRDFYLQDGLYFCEECNVQFANLVEMEYDEKINENFQSQSRIRLAKDKTKEDNLKARRLTSFEEYNFILIGLVDEILNIETIPGFKVTCLQLWMSFLRQSEAAFFDKEQVSVPKLFAVYRNADAEILYNKKPNVNKKKRRPKAKIDNSAFETNRSRRKTMRKSEKIISQELSESFKSETFNSSVLANMSIDDIISDHENAELDIEFSAAASIARRNPRNPQSVESEAKTLFGILKRKERIQIITGSTLLYIIYCALNICGSKIQLSDLIRFVREGHLSFYNCQLLLPEDIIEQDVPLSFQQHHTFHMINYESIRNNLSCFTKLIPDLPTSLIRPNLIELANRYIDELQLPSELKPCVERLMILLPPKMKFNQSFSLVPNYEGRAMAFVVFALKLLFGIDGYREEEMSRSSRLINEVVKDARLEEKTIFVYKDWMAFISYRCVILEKFYHPTLFHRSYDNDKPYLAYKSMLNALNPKPKNMEANNVTTRNAQRMQSKMNAQEMLGRLISNDTASQQQPVSQFTFQSSFTPLRDNFQHILSNDSNFEVNKEITTVDYESHSIEGFLQPDKLVEKLNEAGKHVKKIKSTFPKAFVIVKSKPFNVCRSKEVFEKVVDELTEQEYAIDLKKRRELEKKFMEDEEKNFHEKWIKKILKSRANWQSLIRKKKIERQMAKLSCKKRGDPQTFTEARILSDSSDEDEVNEIDEIAFDTSIDLELAELFQAHAKKALDKELTFVAPDYNLWHRRFYINEMEPYRSEAEMEKMPKNFVWLLNHASSILHQHPLTLYFQLMCIEHQFIYVHQPVQCMHNMMLKQEKQEKGSEHYQKSW